MVTPKTTTTASTPPRSTRWEWSPPRWSLPSCWRVAPWPYSATPTAWRTAQGWVIYPNSWCSKTLKKISQILWNMSYIFCLVWNPWGKWSACAEENCPADKVFCGSGEMCGKSVGIGKYKYDFRRNTISYISCQKKFQKLLGRIKGRRRLGEVVRVMNR